MYNAFTTDKDGRHLVASNLTYHEAERYLESCSNIEIESIDDGMPSKADIESAGIVLGSCLLGAFILALACFTQLA